MATDQMQHSSSVTGISQPSKRALTLGGLTALACYAVHAIFHLTQGRWYDLFWACHVAAILIGVGLLAHSATINGMGVLMGLMGLPLWAADLAAGSEFFPTSVLTHVVALAIGLHGVGRLGMPQGTWWKTTAAVVGLIALCRLATPAAANVNVAFAIQPGWEHYFASHASYLGCTIGAATAYFFVVEWIVRRFVRLDRGDEDPNRH
jgi:hypothetical protein